MNPADRTATYLATLRDEGDRFIAAIEQGLLDAPVEACPGWDVMELAIHLGWVHRWASGVVASGAAIDQRSIAKPPREPDAVLRYAREGLIDLLATLTAANPNAATWHAWRARKIVAVWIRRQAQELMIHRWDAEQAVGTHATLAPERAADGIDEYFELVVPRKIDRDGTVLPEGSLHVHCTDTEGEWLIRVIGSHYELRRQHAKGDLAWSAPAEDILLTLWGRRDLAAAGNDILGDRDLLDRWLAIGGT